MKALINALQLSRMLAVSQKTVFRLAERGEIPSIRIGRSVRFDPDAVARVLKIETNDKRDA